MGLMPSLFGHCFLSHSFTRDIFLIQATSAEIILSHLNACGIIILRSNMLNFADELDLVDLKGRVQKLPDHLNDYAHNIVGQRETYVLVKLQSK